jgi:glycosyltransferase involved in cell wall biosynthesis
MDESRKIAVVSSIAPYPPDSGSKIRIFHIIRVLRDLGLRIFLLIFDSNVTASFPGTLKNWCEDIRVINPARIRQQVSAASRLRHRIIGQPFTPMPSLTEQLHDVLSYWAPHYVQIEKTIGAAYLDIAALKRQGTEVIWEEGGVHHLAYKRLAAIQSNPLKKWLFRRRSRRLKKFEKDAIAAMDAVVAVSQKEADLIHAMNPYTNIILVPNGVCEEMVRTPIRPAGERKMAAFFCGDLSYVPNLQAIEMIVYKLVPTLRARSIKMDFVIAGAGQGPPSSLKARAEKTGSIQFLGYVPDIATLFRRYAILINPMWLGGGTRLKLLEAMAYGSACVSTSIGAEGLEIQNGKHALIADTAEHLSRHLEDLIHNPELATRLGDSAREHVKQKYLWPQCTDRLVRFYLGGGAV